MTRYLLDTDICIYIAKHHPPALRQRFEQAQPGELAMSVVTYGELRHGAEKSQWRAKAIDTLATLTDAITILDLPEQAGARYGAIRADLERAGTPIGANDLWIAAHALAEDLTLVTNNGCEFQRVVGLRVENWAQ
jgi:tRNA(fMet)-specific endonuclease VapC